MRNLFGTQGPPGWLVTGGMASIALAYVFVVFLPTQQALKASRAKLAEKQKYISETESLFAAVNATQPEFEQTRAFTKQWRQNAPNMKQVDRLPSQISSQAGVAGVRILRLEPKAARPHGLVVEYPILVAVEGSFEHIFSFFQEVEQLPQTIWLQDVNLNRPGETGKDLRCELTLTILGDLAEKSD